MVQILGEEEAFKYMKALDDNINQYTKSGAAQPRPWRAARPWLASPSSMT